MMLSFGDREIPSRIWNKITQAPSGCWIWTGSLSGGPQTRWKVDGRWKIISVRRLLFELVHGPQEAEAIGGCTATCVNPAHVRAGSNGQVNIHRAQLRTHCRHGHDLAVVGIYPSKRGGHCRACHALALKRVRDRVRARRLRRMRPARREAFLRKSRLLSQQWSEGLRRRADGSKSLLAQGIA